MSTASCIPLSDSPARNLTHAFEALCVDADVGIVPDSKKLALISPTGVADLDSPASPVRPKVLAPPEATPSLDLHPDLRRDLSLALVNRVSFYGIIHDINKEAAAMAANDCQQPPEAEEASALVVAATGVVKKHKSPQTNAQQEALLTALIDEEVWLLTTIAAREPSERRACPETFLQAMGEKEYENPVASLAGNTRTQLWKPSRSWWEAKSGKNPWIEPSSHNKRWRYLWPLIHYHKFLAKCIKKLKRNSVDVKQSVSPVAVFLREEVCAVSDHLAALSLFDSDQWMAALEHFDGWTDPKAEGDYRAAVRRLKLRPLSEPGDVDSPLLRSQIDEQFLRTMAAAREQLRDTNTTERKKTQPAPYQRSSPVPKQIHSTPADQRRPRSSQYQPPPLPRYWQHQWDHHSAASHSGHYQYSDSSSVHSTLSGDSSYVQSQAPPPPAPHAMYPPMHQYYMPYPPSSNASHASGYSTSVYEGHSMQNGWLDPAMMYSMHMESGYYAPTPHTPHHHPGSPAADAEVADHLEREKIPQKSPEMASPYWAHLDQATLAMGLATPAKASPPRRAEKGDPGFSVNAQPLLLQQGQYYGYGNSGYGAREGYGPPSPATQFMMSPQANFYNYPYSGLPSPARRKMSPHPKANDVSSPPPVRKISPVSERGSGSPSTVETTAETESLHESC